jgi:hypothetical protein
VPHKARRFQRKGKFPAIVASQSLPTQSSARLQENALEINCAAITTEREQKSAAAEAAALLRIDALELDPNAQLKLSG